MWRCAKQHQHAQAYLLALESQGNSFMIGTAEPAITQSDWWKHPVYMPTHLFWGDSAICLQRSWSWNHFSLVTAWASVAHTTIWICAWPVTVACSHSWESILHLNVHFWLSKSLTQKRHVWMHKRYMWMSFSVPGTHHRHSWQYITLVWKADARHLHKL